MSNESTTPFCSRKGTAISYLRLGERTKESVETSKSGDNSAQMYQIPADEGWKCQLKVNKESKLVKL